MNTLGMADCQLMSEEDRSKANKALIQYLEQRLTDGRRGVIGLRRKLSSTYVIIVILSIVMFAVGIILLAVPVVAAFSGEIGTLQSLIAAGFGIADLATLFLFRPLDRMHSLMGDMSQITLAVNSYQTQVGLRLLEMDKDKRETVGQAAERISEASRVSITLIQDYFEGKEKLKA